MSDLDDNPTDEPEETTTEATTTETTTTETTHEPEAAPAEEPEPEPEGVRGIPPEQIELDDDEDQGEAVHDRLAAQEGYGDDDAPEE